MGLLHGSLAEKSEYFEVVGIVDPSLFSRMIIRGMGIKKPLYSKLSDALKSNQSGIALICTPPSTHFAIAKECIGHGWGLFVEKPLTTDPDHSKELKESSKERLIFNQVGFHLRFSPVIEYIRKLNREHGQIKIMNLNILSPQFAFIEEHEPGLHRGGIGWDLFPHVVDLCVHLSDAESLDEVDILRTEGGGRSIFVEMELNGARAKALADWGCKDVRKVETSGRLVYGDGFEIEFDGEAFVGVTGKGATPHLGIRRRRVDPLSK